MQCSYCFICKHDVSTEPRQYWRRVFKEESFPGIFLARNANGAQSIDEGAVAAAVSAADWAGLNHAKNTSADLPNYPVFSTVL